MRSLGAAILLTLLFQQSHGQLRTDSLSFWEKSADLNKARFYTLTGTGAVALSGTYLVLGQLWYSDYPRSSFHLFDDANNWLAMDKVGHSMSAYYIGYAGKSLLEWAGVSEKQANWFGGSLGFVFLTGVEVFDGFSEEWGFSWADMAANASGTALLIGQELLWEEQRIVMKYSFHQTKYAAVRPDLLGGEWYESMLKDYNGQTYWVSANVRDLSNWERWPAWLNVAAGYGADGMVSANYNPAIYEGNEIYKWQRQYYLSLDIDLRKIPVKSPFLKTVFNAVNFIKIPMPTLEYNQREGVRFYPVYF